MEKKFDVVHMEKSLYVTLPYKWCNSSHWLQNKLWRRISLNDSVNSYKIMQPPKKSTKVYIFVIFLNNMVFILSVEMLISVVGDQNGIFL